MNECRKSFGFCAAHRLQRHTGRCRGVHGHNYHVEVAVAAPVLNHDGMVLDFGDMRPLRDWVDANWDHALLLEHGDPLLAIQQLREGARIVTLPWAPTAENMARELYTRAREMLHAEVSEVTVWETPTSRATYSE